MAEYQRNLRPNNSNGETSGSSGSDRDNAAVEVEESEPVDWSYIKDIVQEAKDRIEEAEEIDIQIEDIDEIVKNAKNKIDNIDESNYNIKNVDSIANSAKDRIDNIERSILDPIDIEEVNIDINFDNIGFIFANFDKIDTNIYCIYNIKDIVYCNDVFLVHINVKKDIYEIKV